MSDFTSSTKRAAAKEASIVSANRRLSKIALVLAGLCMVLVAGLVHVSGSPRTIPYYVQVDDVGGYAVIGEIKPTTIDDGVVIRALVKRWVRDIRSVYQEPAALQRSMRDAWAHVPTSSPSQAQLTQHFNQAKNNPGILSGTVTRTVHEVESIALMEESGKDTQWRVQWVEQTIGATSRDRKMMRWEAFITVRSEAPTNKETIQINPLGFWITQINWSIMTEIK